MPRQSKKYAAAVRLVAFAGIGLSLCACSLLTGRHPGEMPPPAVPAEEAEAAPAPVPVPIPLDDVEMVEVSSVPQRFAGLAKAAGERLALGESCRERLLHDFRERFYAPWTAKSPIFDLVEARALMRDESRRSWYGENKRKMPGRMMRELLENCALSSFPSRSLPAVAVAPGHLRGLPTNLPLYETSEDEPFDMLSFPQVKLNEPLRVLHVSRDGVWYFVETGYANGWIETRDVALVDAATVRSRMEAPQVVVVKDFSPIADGRGTGTFPAKIGTILPLVVEAEQGAGDGKGEWRVAIASAGDGGKAEIHPSAIPRQAAASFPLVFNGDNITAIGDQLLGQPYGWGESYDLRDCSAMLRDFFLPFGIWLPRTSADQIASLPRRVGLAGMTTRKKEQEILKTGVPFLTLLYKPGHIMLYVGTDAEGKPLVFHDAWSIRVKSRGREQTRIIGSSVITTLEPGKGLGLVPGTSLLDRITELGVIPDRCQVPVARARRSLHPSGQIGGK
jgi:hypothetical protein